MFVSGFTIIKNAIINDYPIVEAIQSILPIVDEMIVLVGDCEDDTLQLIETIQDSKIKIHHSVWDKTLRQGGQVLAVETNKAFALINPNATWAFYIQADEAVHEKYHPTITDAMKKYADDNRVEGLLFKYLHFYGTYDYVGDSRKWYDKEIRIIRNDKRIQSYKDAQGFRKNDKKLQVKMIDAYIYHYGWVKSLSQMKAKLKESGKFWHDDESNNLTIYQQHIDKFNFENYDSVKKFIGTQPKVLYERVSKQSWNWDVDINKNNLSFKNKVLKLIETITGVRLFTYKNYKII